MNINLQTAFGDLFKTPEKWMTLLLLSVCVLIPIVGPIVISGYLIQRFAGVRKGLPEADFKFDFFTDYLQIGLWPFLCSLLLSVIVLPFFLLCYAPLLLLAIEPQSEIMVVIAIALLLLCFIVLSVLLTLLTYPVTLRSGLMMQFGAGFSKRFIFGFIKRCGWQILLWTIILTMISIPACLFGYMALIIGIYPVIAVLYFASYHLMFQIYDLYLERGGEEIQVADLVYGSIPPPPPAQPSATGIVPGGG